MAYNTGNPLGSTDPRDLYDNSENLDYLVNGEQESYDDRLGNARKSWAGIEEDFQAFLSDSGYVGTGTDGAIQDYASGIELTSYNQIIRDNGEFWRLSASEDLPYTTDGSGIPEGGAFVSVGDATLRQDLAAPPLTGQGAALVNGAIIYVGSVAESLNGLSGIDGARYEVTGWHDGERVGGQSLAYDPDEPKSNHGRTGWSPTVPAVSEQAGGSLSERRDNYLNAEGETDTGGTGLFVITDSALYPETYGALDTLDDTLPVQRATDVRSDQGGGFVAFMARIYLATRLIPRTGVTWFGTWGASYLQCTDSTTLDANVSLGSFVRAEDDGNRVVRFGIKGVGIISTLSGAAASQDTFSDIIGLNLCGCERGRFEDVQFLGFGQGAVVLARAEAGAEGLGFVNTTQDANYNTFYNINVGACGIYNSDEAAIWFKYKANSNKFYGVFLKGTTRVSFGFVHANDNLISGSTTESAQTIAYFGDLAAGNVITSARAEGLSSHAYDFADGAQFNTVMGGYYTGVDGNHANNIENTSTNTVIDAQLVWLAAGDFPPTASVSSQHVQQVATFRAVNGDNNTPLFVKSPQYNVTGTYPVVEMWDSKLGPTDGDIIGSYDFRNRDSTGGAAGVSGRMVAVMEGGGGQTAIAFWTGTGTTAAEKFRVKSNGDVEMADAGAGIILKSPDGAGYKLTVDNAGALVTTAV